jgi:hypothetical protein
MTTSYQLPFFDELSYLQHELRNRRAAPLPVMPALDVECEKEL